MNFTILQVDIWPALQAVSRCVGVRSQLPVLGNILISTAGKKLQLSATNLEMAVVKSINKVGVTQEGEITVPAKTLLEIVSNLSGKLQFRSSNEVLTITSGSFSSQINGILASEFPSIPLSGKDEVVFEPGVLTTVVPEVAFAAAVDEGRPQLTAILTEIKDDPNLKKGKKLQLVATDGFRLAHKAILVDKSATFSSLIPKTTLEEVVRLVSEEEVDQIKVSLSEDNNQMIFSFGNTTLSSRLIEGQFPAWEKIIPTEFKARIIVERALFIKAVRLAAVFAKSEANVVKLEAKLKKLILSSEAKELGSQINELEAQVEGEGLTVAFNSRYLMDVLNATHSAQIILELSGALSAAVLKPMGEEGLEYIIMPINLS